MTLVLWSATWSTLENVLHVLGKNVYSAVVWLVYSIVQVLYLLTDRLTSFSILYWKWAYWSLQLLLWNFLFLLFCHCFVCIFGDFFGCLYVYNCYIFLMNYSFDYIWWPLCLLLQFLKSFVRKYHRCCDCCLRRVSFSSVLSLFYLCIWI